MIQRPCPQPPLWPEALLWVPESNSLLDKTTWISNRLIKLNSPKTELQTNPTHHLVVPTSLLESANINPIHLIAQDKLPAVHLSVDPSLSWMPQFNPSANITGLIFSDLQPSLCSAWFPGFCTFPTQDVHGLQLQFWKSPSPWDTCRVWSPWHLQF